MPVGFQSYVDDLKQIRDGAKQSLDDAQTSVDRIVDGALNDFTGDSGTYADFYSGNPPIPIQMPSPTPELVIPEFDDSWLNEFDPYEVLETARYDSEFLEDLEQNCRSVFAGTIPGFTYGSVVSLFQWREEQDQRDMQLEMDQASVEFGARRGFPIPADAETYKKNEIMRRYSHTQFDRTRENTTLLANTLIDAYKNAMDSGIRIEDIRSRMVTAVMDALVARIRAEVDVYQATIAGLVADFEGEIKLIQTEAEIARTNGILDNQYYDNIIRKTLGLRNIKLGIINREYDEVNVQNQLKVSSAEVLMKAWSDIYGSAALGVQTSAEETYQG